MKSIQIEGKRNIDKIDKVEKPERTKSKKWEFEEKYYEYNNQICLINMLYLQNGTCEKHEEEIIKREIKTKITGYKNQDIDKKCINLLKLISLEEVIEKLVESKLKCYYCKEKCLLLYKYVLDNKQWTLDRINNNEGHNNDNVVISCLECNIKRGTMDSERFKKGKSIKIVKKLY